MVTKRFKKGIDSQNTMKGNNAYAAKSKSAQFMPYAGEVRTIKRDVNPYGAKTPLGVFFYLLRNDLILRTNPAYATTTESKIEAKPFVMPGLQEPQSQAGKKQPYRQYGQPYSDDKPFAIKPVIKGTYRDLFEKMSGRQRGIYR